MVPSPCLFLHLEALHSAEKQPPKTPWSSQTAPIGSKMALSRLFHLLRGAGHPQNGLPGAFAAASERVTTATDEALGGLEVQSSANNSGRYKVVEMYLAEFSTVWDTYAALPYRQRNNNSRNAGRRLTSRSAKFLLFLVTSLRGHSQVAGVRIGEAKTPGPIFHSFDHPELEEDWWETP